MRLVVSVAAVASVSLAGLFGAAPIAEASPAERVAVRELAGTDGWQEARGVVAAPVEVVRGWLLDFRRWPERFSDVKSVELMGQDGGATVFRYHSRAADRHFLMRARATTDGMVYSGGDDDGLSTEGKVWLTATADGRTDVIYQNASHLGGLLGALAPKSLIRSRQRDGLATEIRDLQRLAARWSEARQGARYARRD